MSRKIEPEWASEVRPKHMTSLPNEENKKPQGGGAKRRLLGAAPKAPPCCFPFGKDFLCFGLISGAHPEAFPPSFFVTVHLPWFSQLNYAFSGTQQVVLGGKYRRFKGWLPDDLLQSTPSFFCSTVLLQPPPTAGNHQKKF